MQTVVERTFKFHMPIEPFQKAVSDGTDLRIGGVLSTANMDRQEEQILAEALDFRNFIDYGYFNDNHSESGLDVLGYPTEVRRIKKGEMLPHGKISPGDGWWGEGYLLGKYKKARDWWDLAQALEGTPRKLGFSIEGVTQRRDTQDRRKVIKARVDHVAITHAPVNTDTEFVRLAKSLLAAHNGEKIDGEDESEDAKLERERKALSAASGAVLVPQSLEAEGARALAREQERRAAVQLSKAQVLTGHRLNRIDAFALILTQFPYMSSETAGRLVDFTASLSRAA